MKKITVIKENGKVKDWEMDFDEIGFDVYEVNEKELNLVITEKMKIKDFFNLKKDDFPVLSDVFIMTEDSSIEFHPRIKAVGIKRRDDRFETTFMFDDITVGDEIMNLPGQEILRYLEMVVQTKSNMSVHIPFEYDDDAASIYIGISGEFENEFKEFYFDCCTKLKNLIEETAEYLNNIEKSIQSNKFQVRLPEELIVPISQYLTYFKTYVEKTKGDIISVQVNEFNKGIEIAFGNSDDVEISQIKEWMLEFISLIKQNVEQLNFPISRPLNDNELSIVTLSLKQQVSHLQNSLDLVRLENKLLKENNEYVKQLMANISRQPIQINNYIKNDSYSFINKVIESSDVLTKNDRELVKLIYENTSSEEERIELVENLKKIKDPTVSEEDKEKSKSVFKKFMEKGLSEATKQIFKNLVDSGFDMFIN